MTQQALKHKQLYEANKNKHVKKITCHYLNSYLKNIHHSPEYREAASLKSLWENCEVIVHPYELVVGNITYSEPVYFNIGSGTTIDPEIIHAYIKQEKLDEQSVQELYAGIDQVKAHHYMCYFDKDFLAYYPDYYNQQQRAGIQTTAATCTFFGGHMVLDYEQIIKRGLSAYAEDIAGYEKTVNPQNPEFYEAMGLILQAFQIVIKRTADECELVASSVDDIQQKQYLTSMTKDLNHIVNEKPTTFVQALHLVWFAHICSGSDTFGRFDQYLYPFYKADIDSGLLTPSYATALMESFMVKIDEQESIQSMTIGGIKPDGASGYNDLTLMIMAATREVGYKGPNLCLRINQVMPDFYWDEITRSLASGQGLPALYNDEVMIAYLIKSGIPQEDANDFCLAGCSQIMIGGRCQFINDIGMMNIAKILELTCYNGVDKAMTSISTGFVTGEPDSFKTFDEFLQAFESQLGYFSRIEAEVNNLDIKLRGDTEGYTIRSLFTRDCLETGRGVFKGGARFNNVELECIGITNAADSLAAIKKLVFDEKQLSLSELESAMESDFVGFESLQSQLKNKIPKFGNDIAWVDAIRKEITEVLFDELHKQPGILGGIYVPGEVIFIAHESMGKMTGATPDGRKKCEVLADSAGASQGMDKNGPTALMNSLLKIPVDGIVTSIVLNLKFMKTTWESDRLKAALLFQTFFKAGGQQLQINVCDNATLQKAFDNPQEYQSLVIRVGGYSAYYTSLSKVLQKEIIERTCNII